MSSKIKDNKLVVVPDAPPMPELTWRRFRGERDYPAMVAVIEGSKEADGLEWTLSVEQMAIDYQHLRNCDPYQDILVVEAKGRVIGYSRVWWQAETSGPHLYNHFAHLLPAWRGQGIRRAMLRYNERRLREVAAKHTKAQDRFFQTGASERETHWENLLLDEGYERVRYGLQMVRPDLNDIPDRLLPPGLEVRPVRPEHYELVRQALNEAFQDHWGAIEWSQDWIEHWQKEPTFDPSLWQVAWDGDEIAGTVLPFINQQENAEYERQRGYTEFICVRRPWRRRGLAKALIARGLRVLKERGMREAALNVDAQNLSGALQLYQSMGFRTAKRNTTLRKALVGVEDPR